MTVCLCLSLSRPSRADPSWGRRETLLRITPAMFLHSYTQWVLCVWCRARMAAVAALFTPCLVLTAAALCVSGQFTGTEMTCEDLGPSASTPTSGEMVYTYQAFIRLPGEFQLAKQCKMILYTYYHITFLLQRLLVLQDRHVEVDWWDIYF